MVKWRFAPLGLGLIYFLQGCGEAPPPQQGPPQVDIGIIKIASEPVTLTTRLPGRTKASLQAEVRPQISGIILEQLFEEGAMVEKGAQLYLIDPAPFEADLNRARADLSKARANLKTAKARADRYKILVDANAVSRQDYDDALAQYEQAEAEIETATAAVTQSKINLDYTRVYAPITGLAGRSSVTAGALVTSSQSQALVTVQQFDPMFVDVSESSRELNRLRRAWNSGQIIRQEGEAARVRLLFDDGAEYEHYGEFKFADINVDVSTSTFTIRTTFPNPDNLLLPGMFVRAELVKGIRPNGILVPAKGVSRDPKGQATVMVINDKGEAELRLVTASELIGQSWLVTEGLNDGDQVILEGLQFVRPGMPVPKFHEVEQE
ncbi:efflux RND transporter periplasmic adaptor subunit [Ferrimonas marina]|uniref:Membrane fusion protein, multidrug efflux system n=1 Tax=Ferrimonas marina TaxID=299255 RepID=A0A1M5P3C9_9GAMM|nr:efflux RND transporter periplasmic adaptor subunit [Ferrimonas marina]SHG95683.1 membrane fusion protein, multidrug efflux system [Ferrimonas marina]